MPGHERRTVGLYGETYAVVFSMVPGGILVSNIKRVEPIVEAVSPTSRIGKRLENELVAILKREAQKP